MMILSSRALSVGDSKRKDEHSCVGHTEVAPSIRANILSLEHNMKKDSVGGEDNMKEYERT